MSIIVGIYSKYKELRTSAYGKCVIAYICTLILEYAFLLRRRYYFYVEDSAPILVWDYLIKFAIVACISSFLWLVIINFAVWKKLQWVLYLILKLYIKIIIILLYFKAQFYFIKYTCSLWIHDSNIISSDFLYNIFHTRNIFRTWV